MKSLLFFITFLTIGSVNAQEYDTEIKINKHVSIVYKNDLLGVTVDKKIVIPIENYEYSKLPSGIVIYKDSMTGFIDYNGKIIVPCLYSDIMEDNEYGILSVVNTKNEYALFDLNGKVIVPFGKHEPHFTDKGIILLAGDYSSMYDYNGNILIPYGQHTIELVDEKGEYVCVRTSPDEGRMWLNIGYTYPKGYRMINPHFFAKQTEVSIEEYFLYVSHQKENGYFYDEISGETILFTDLLPDTNFVEPKLLSLYRHLYRELAIEEGGSEHSETKIEFENKSFTVYSPYELSKLEKKMSEFPVTGISISQAKRYANWLEMMYNEWFYNYYGYMFTFRLPAEEEWIILAEDGLNEAMKKQHVLDSVNAENCMLFIYTNLPKCKGYEDYLKASLGSGTVPVMNMNPDLNGCFQLFGNVSEMTSTPGIAKGGNFQLPAKDASTLNKQSYSSPTPWLGFRLIGAYKL